MNLNSLKTEQKPFDVIEPIVIDPSNYAEFAELIALMLLGDLRYQEQMLDWETQEAFHLFWYGQRANIRRNDGSDTNAETVAWGHGEADRVMTFGQTLEDDAFNCMEPDYRDIVCTLVPGQLLACGIGPCSYVCLNVSPKDSRRWELAAAAILEVSRGNPLGDEDDLSKKPVSLRPLLHDYKFDDALQH